MPAKQWGERLEDSYMTQQDDEEIAEHVIEFTPPKPPIVEFGPVPNAGNLANDLYVHPKVGPPVVIQEGAPENESTPRIAREAEWLVRKPPEEAMILPIQKRTDMRPAPHLVTRTQANAQVPQQLRLVPKPQKSNANLHFNVNVNTRDLDEEATNIILIEKSHVTFWKTCSAVGVVSALALLSALGLMYWCGRRRRKEEEMESSNAHVRTQAEGHVTAAPAPSVVETRVANDDPHRCARCGRLKRPAGTWRRYPMIAKPHDHRHNHHACICAVAPCTPAHGRSRNRVYKTNHEPSSAQKRRSFSEDTTGTGSTFVSSDATPIVMNRRHFVRRPVWEV